MITINLAGLNIIVTQNSLSFIWFSLQKFRRFFKAWDEKLQSNIHRSCDMEADEPVED